MRNLAANGGFDIDQEHEGAAVPVTGTNRYLADGWLGSDNDTGCTGVTAQRVTDVPPASGLLYSGKLTVTGAAPSLTAGARLRIHNRIGPEDVAHLRFGTPAARITSLSFWAKASRPGTYAATLCNRDGTRCLYRTFILPTANAWHYLRVDGIPGCPDGDWSGPCWGYMVFSAVLGSSLCDPAPAQGQWRPAHVGADGSLTNDGVLHPGFTFQVTGVMWTETPAAVPYQPDPHALARRQRRYRKSYVGVPPGTPTPDGAGYGYVSIPGNVFGTYERFEQPMAAAPAVTLYSPVTGAAGKVRELDTNTDVAATVINPSRGGFGFYAHPFPVHPGALWHWVADARL